MSRKRTSSLLVCFCRLALTPEASLAAVVLCWVSRTGLGMLEGPGVAGLFVAKGMAPRPWPRLGVPLNVPGVPDMISTRARIQRDYCSLQKIRFFSQSATQGENVERGFVLPRRRLSVEEVAVRTWKSPQKSTDRLTRRH
jgi:hypothetical protein